MKGPVSRIAALAATAGSWPFVSSAVIFNPVSAPPSPAVVDG